MPMAKSGVPEKLAEKKSVILTTNEEGPRTTRERRVIRNAVVYASLLHDGCLHGLLEFEQRLLADADESLVSMQQIEDEEDYHGNQQR